MPSPSREDYLEMIYRLSRETGAVRITDIARGLGISLSSVTKMIRRLQEQAFVTYVPYHHLRLTPEGEALGQRLLGRHETLSAFLTLLGLQDAQAIYRDVEGIEHHVSPFTLARIQDLVDHAAVHPAWWQQFLDAKPSATDC